jgi:hypothetical protein
MSTNESNLTTEPKTTSAASLRDQSRHFVTTEPLKNIYLVRRPSPEALITEGELPEELIAAMFTVRQMASKPESDDEADAQPATEEIADPSPPTRADLLAEAAAHRAVVTAALIRPRVVKREAQNANEIEYEDIPITDRTYLYLWIVGKIKDAAVATENGGTTAGALANFSTEEQPSERAATSKDLATIGA